MKSGSANMLELSLYSGDYIVVTNARKVMVTGRKAEQKVYRSHSQFPGGLKEISYATMMEKKPDQVGRGSRYGLYV
jgi:large subunit ribosomal protein L13